MGIHFLTKKLKDLLRIPSEKKCFLGGGGGYKKNKKNKKKKKGFFLGALL